MSASALIATAPDAVVLLPAAHSTKDGKAV
jgi:hypothetical protein